MDDPAIKASEFALHQIREQRLAVRAATLAMPGVDQLPQPVGELLAAFVETTQSLETLALALISRLEALETQAVEYVDRVGALEEVVFEGNL